MARHRAPEIGQTEFRLLFVCTGNICRSPLAEILTRHLLIGRLGGRAAGEFDVSSAGVNALVGAPIHQETRAELARWNLHTAAAGRFSARQVTPALIDASHLVLGASPQHRSAVIQLAPTALATAFSIREFARLIGQVDPGRLPRNPVARAHTVIEEAHRMRGVLPRTGRDGDRIPDPMGGAKGAHHRAAVMIDEAVQQIVDMIAPRAAPPGLR